MLKRISVVLVFVISAAIPWPMRAEAQNAPQPGPESAGVKVHEQAARKAAGTEWLDAFQFFCDPDQKNANKPDDPVIRPAKIFDNLYAVGRTSTIVYALDTPEGIILIDSGYANDVETVLLRGLTELKLDPSRIKHVVISHAHADHFGGAKYLQDRYGAHVWVSAADWEVMLQPPAAGRGPGVAPPNKDQVIIENQPITLGSESLTPVLLPGHTPGTIALIFPVKDGNKTHFAGYLGAPMLIPPPDPAVEQHIQSLDHFGQIARKMKVDVELLNHPLMDGMTRKIAKLQQRNSGAPNPFVVGDKSYQRFLTVSSECLKGVLARRAARRAGGQ